MCGTEPTQAHWPTSSTTGHQRMLAHIEPSSAMAIASRLQPGRSMWWKADARDRDRNDAGGVEPCRARTPTIQVANQALPGSAIHAYQQCPGHRPAPGVPTDDNKARSPHDGGERLSTRSRAAPSVTVTMVIPLSRGSWAPQPIVSSSGWAALAAIWRASIIARGGLRNVSRNSSVRRFRSS